MISIASTSAGQPDWSEWAGPLHQFAQATGLTLSAYDIGGQRRIGPLFASRTATMLGATTLWNDDGPGSALERRIVAIVAASGQPAPDEFFHGLRVSSLPLVQFGKVYGVIVFGWSFRDFSSPLACEQIGHLIDFPGHVLWGAVRLESPISDGRMATHAALLRTLVESIDRQRDTITQLNRVSRTRDLFLATVSHEMRTPLAALSMRLDLLLRTNPDLPATVVASVNAMRVHVRQEAAMVDDLIDAARTLTGQLSVVRAPVPLGRIVRDAVSTVEVKANDKNIALSVTPADFGDAIFIAGDAGRLQQVIWNLLLNAVKFTPVGGSIHIDISVGRAGVRIDVIDNGQGIAAEDLPHVFGAFTLQRDGNATGLGLGLYIARRVVELHGGSLTVASAGAGLGSTFTVRLPIEK